MFCYFVLLGIGYEVMLLLVCLCIWVLLLMIVVLAMFCVLVTCGILVFAL